MGWKATMGGVKVAGGGGGVEKVRCPSVAAVARSRMRPWVLRATTTVLLWTCVMQLTAVGERWGPRVLKGWPSCRTAQEAASAALAATRLPMPVPVVEKAPLPPKSEYPHYPAFACSFLETANLPWIRRLLHDAYGFLNQSPYTS
jgi:hypothetical protein